MVMFTPGAATCGVSTPVEGFLHEEEAAMLSAAHAVFPMSLKEPTAIWL
jgi:hypothetical protein